MVSIKAWAPNTAAIYTSSVQAFKGEFSVVDTLDERFSKMRLMVSLRPDIAPQLVVGGLPRSRLPVLIGLFALTASLVAAAIYQLRRQQQLAQLRVDFVSGVSHELRTPLAQIKLYLETLRTGRASTSEQRDWSLGHIERETTRLGNLVENVLRFSRLGRTDGAPAQPIDLADEVERVVEEFRPLAASRKNSIHLVIRSHPLVRMRPEGVRHVIVNLLDNAVKYGPVSQTVSVEVDMRNGNAEVSVSDQGEGVREGDREAIWRAFARAKTPTDAAGSGIGLTIVHDVVSTNGGKTWVESAPSGGARFVVSVPAAGTSAARGPQNGVTSELEPVSIE